jgi:hypothetical protein
MKWMDEVGSGITAGIAYGFGISHAQPVAEAAGSAAVFSVVWIALGLGFAVVRTKVWK